jgi:hypothetical protein
VGVFVLLVASPAVLLAWYGLGVVLFVGVLAWRGWAGLPDGSHVSPAVLFGKVPLAVVGGAALAVSVAALLVWTVVLVFGSVVKMVLVVALCCAVVAVATTWFGLWRLWARAEFWSHER